MFYKAVTSKKWFLLLVSDLERSQIFVKFSGLCTYRNCTLISTLIFFYPSLSKTAWKNQRLGGKGNVRVFSITYSILVNVTHSVLFLLPSSLVKVICKYHDALNSSSKQTNITFSYLSWAENCKNWSFATPLFFIALALVVHALLGRERYWYSTSYIERLKKLLVITIYTISYHTYIYFYFNTPPPKKKKIIGAHFWN